MADDSLDDMLLEAAGRPKESENKQPSSRRGFPSREYSSEDDDKSDSELDGDEDGRFRKEPGSKMPLKKRFDALDKDSEEGGHGYDSEASYGSDLYKDEEDRKRLAEMSELDREYILSERSEKRDSHLKKKRAEVRQAEASKQRERREGPPSSRVRSSSGREVTKTSQKEALNQLVAKRKAQDTDQQRRRRDLDAPHDKDSRKKRPSSPSSFSSSQSEEEEEDSSREESNRSDGVPSDDDRAGMDDFPDSNEIKDITIRRSKLFKWFMEPFFEEVIVGCFVRIGIGTSNSGESIYRLCLVKNVDAKDPDKVYKFENRTTYKYLNCTWGDDSTAARWQMVRVSDQPPTDQEIDAWKNEVLKSNGRRITKDDVQEKNDALTRVNSYVYSAAAVKQMLQEKKMATVRPSNIALEKDRVVKELALSENNGNSAEVERLQQKLKELESYSQKVQQKNSEKAERIEKMNRKNKFENFKNASELKPVNTNAKAGEAGYDPFSRRWTRSQNYYKPDAPKTLKDGEGKEGDESAASLASEDPTKLANTQAPVDSGTKLFTLHDFDLPISLERIQKFGGAQGAATAFMERKQRLEATCGVQVESNDGRRHSLTLSVNDYKRRRGLL